jgi:hypothetical protein
MGIAKEIIGALAASTENPARVSKSASPAKRPVYMATSEIWESRILGIC